jgi:hypothetical protein
MSYTWMECITYFYTSKKVHKKHVIYHSGISRAPCELSYTQLSYNKHFGHNNIIYGGQ